MASSSEAAEIAKQLGFTLNESALAKALEELEEFEREARELRRRSADWEFIEKQPEPIRAALKLLVETGDLRLAARIAGLPVDELDEVRIKARIPIVL
jgi:GAF domain-containing protein